MAMSALREGYQRRTVRFLAVLSLAAAWFNCSSLGFLSGGHGKANHQEKAGSISAESSRRAMIAASALSAALGVQRVAPALAVENDKEWLANKAQEPGVITLPSGLMYKVLEEGAAGGRTPTLKEKCDVTYAGQLTSGRQFDAGTLSFAPNQVIKGWTEAMQMMKEGDKWELYIPSKLAYGDRGFPGAIPPGSSLVFQMKINKVLR